KILAALYTILLGNPQLKTPHNAEAKTRFKMWWRLVGSAVEHAANLAREEIEKETNLETQHIDFQKLFITQEADDEDSASLADVLKVMRKKWPATFQASDLAGWLNNENPYEPNDDDKQTLRDFLTQTANSTTLLSAKSISRLLKKRLDEPARSGDQTLVLRKI